MVKKIILKGNKYKDKQNLEKLRQNGE